MPAIDRILYSQVTSEGSIIKYSFYWDGITKIGFAIVTEGEWVFMEIRPPNEIGLWNSRVLRNIADVLDHLNGTINLRITFGELPPPADSNDNPEYEF